MDTSFSDDYCCGCTAPLFSFDVECMGSLVNIICKKETNPVNRDVSRLIKSTEWRND